MTVFPLVASPFVTHPKQYLEYVRSFQVEEPGYSPFSLISPTKPVFLTEKLQIEVRCNYSAGLEKFYWYPQEGVVDLELCMRFSHSFTSEIYVLEKIDLNRSKVKVSLDSKGILLTEHQNSHEPVRFELFIRPNRSDKPESWFPIKTTNVIICSNEESVNYYWGKLVFLELHSEQQARSFPSGTQLEGEYIFAHELLSKVRVIPWTARDIGWISNILYLFVSKSLDCLEDFLDLVYQFEIPSILKYWNRESGKKYPLGATSSCKYLQNQGSRWIALNQAAAQVVWSWLASVCEFQVNHLDLVVNFGAPVFMSTENASNTLVAENNPKLVILRYSPIVNTVVFSSYVKNTLKHFKFYYQENSLISMIKKYSRACTLMYSSQGESLLSDLVAYFRRNVTPISLYTL